MSASDIIPGMVARELVDACGLDGMKLHHMYDINWRQTVYRLDVDAGHHVTFRVDQEDHREPLDAFYEKHLAPVVQAVFAHKLEAA